MHLSALIDAFNLVWSSLANLCYVLVGSFSARFALCGYVIDKKRMENGAFLDEDYFERLLEEIREIRLSERRFYQKITDIYATAMGYNPESSTTKDFLPKCITRCTTLFTNIRLRN
jgi:hypothetical protein